MWFRGYEMLGEKKYLQAGLDFVDAILQTQRGDGMFPAAARLRRGGKSEGRAGARLVRLLESVAEPRHFIDPVDALVAIGAERPALVMLSHRIGSELVGRLGDAIESTPWLGYVCVVQLVAGKDVPWQDGPLPQPLVAGESAGRGLSTLVGSLLGTA